MKFNWKWFLGFVIVLILLAVPMLWRLGAAPVSGYGMMRNYGYMPMMNYGYGMMPFFGMGLVWLTSIGVLTLIALGIIWLVKQIAIKEK